MSGERDAPPSAGTPPAAGSAGERRARLARRNWGRWGSGDERGSPNLNGPAEIAAASRLVRRGEVLSLAHPIDRASPTPPIRPAPAHFMHRDGGDYAGRRDRPPRSQYSDDSILLALHTATHVDALAHVWYGNEIFNGFARETVTSSGARRCGVENLGPIVGRGVLLDVAAAAGSESLPDERQVTADDLERCAAVEGVGVGRADIVLIRTGWWSARAGIAGQTFEREPGPNLAAACWLAERDVAVVGTDNFAFEALPSLVDGATFPAHELLLCDCGTPILEGLALDELARRRIYEFLFVAAPLPLVGGTASPLNPLAIL